MAANDACVCVCVLVLQLLQEYMWSLGVCCIDFWFLILVLFVFIFLFGCFVELFDALHVGVIGKLNQILPITCLMISPHGFTPL